MKLAAALGAAAGLLLVVGSLPAGAEQRAQGGSTAYDCDYQPGGLCTCDGGHNQGDCEALKRSRICADEDGLVILCCAGGGCTCRLGGPRGGEMCPTGSSSVTSRVPPGGIARPRGPGAAPPRATGGSAATPKGRSTHSIVQMSDRKAANPKQSPPRATEGSAATPKGRSTHSIVQMGGRKVGGLAAGTGRLDPEACSCWNGIGSCTVEGDRCAPRGGDLGCTGTCAVKDPGIGLVPR